MWCVAVISYIFLVQRQIYLCESLAIVSLFLLGRNENKCQATKNYGANNTNFSIVERNCYRQATKSNFIKSNNLWKWSVWAKSGIGIHIFTNLHTKLARGSEQNTHKPERQQTKKKVLRMHKERVQQQIHQLKCSLAMLNWQRERKKKTGNFVWHFSTFRAKMSVSWVNRWQWMCKGAYFSQWTSLLIVAWLYLFFSLLCVLHWIYDILHSLLSLFASLLSFPIVPFNVSFCWQKFLVDVVDFGYYTQLQSNVFFFSKLVVAIVVALCSLCQADFSVFPKRLAPTSSNKKWMCVRHDGATIYSNIFQILCRLLCMYKLIQPTEVHYAINVLKML